MISKVKYIRLGVVAKQLGCEQDDLLDNAISGNINLYAPILNEGIYEWPVSQIGVAYKTKYRFGDVPFKTKFYSTDYVILSRVDVNRIKTIGWVIPPDFLCPSVALEVIEHWKSTQNKDIKDLAGPVERMKALAHKVPWIPSLGRDAIAILLPERDPQPEWKRPVREDFKVTADTLRISHSDVERLKRKVSEAVRIEVETLPIGEDWEGKSYVSMRLRTLILLAKSWEQQPFHEGISKDEYRDWHEQHIQSVLLERSAFHGRAELANFSAEFIRPLYARRTGGNEAHMLFKDPCSPELRSLYHAAKLWDGWSKGKPEPKKIDIAAEIKRLMQAMQFNSTKMLLKHGPKIIQPEAADSGRERQQVKGAAGRKN